MYELNRFTHLKLNAGIVTAWLVCAMLAQPSAMAQVSIRLAAPAGSQTIAMASDAEARRLLALDAAIIAARGKLFDLSISAAARAAEQSAVIASPDFQSSLLGGGPSRNANIVSGSSNARAEPPGQIAIRQRLEELVDVWKEMEAPPEKVAAVLQRMVLPTDKGQAVQTFAPPSGNEMVRSLNFSATDNPAPLPRALGFDAVEWARAAGQLDALIAAMEKRVDEPASRIAASALLIYAERIANRPEAVTKILEKLLADNAQPKGESKLVIVALLRPLPEDVEASDLDESKIADFSVRMLASDPNGEEVRAYVIQRLMRAIEQGDRANVNRYADGIESSIDQLTVVEAQYKPQLKSSFWTSAERECLRREQADLAIEFAVRQNAGGQRAVGYSGSYQDRLRIIAQGSSEQRMERARRLLLESPLASLDQLNFGTIGGVSKPPAFFQSSDSFEEVLAHAKPYKDSNTVSLLDILLNEAEARGDAEQVVDQLFKNASDRDDLIKLVARWMMLRAEKRGTQLDEKITALGHFDNEQDFIDWVKRMPPAAAIALLSRHIADGPLSDPLVELFEHSDPSSNNNDFRAFMAVSEFAEKYYQRQNPSAQAVRPITALKHWSVAMIDSDIEPTGYRAILGVPSAQGKQGLGYNLSPLRLRFPVTGELTIKGTFKTSSLHASTLGLNGIAVRLNTMASVLFRQRYGDSRPSIQLADSNTIAWSVSDGALSLSIDGAVKRKWRQDEAGCPFVLLSNDSVSGAVPEDLTITGNIQIPREVALIDRGLTGWNSVIFYHALPVNAETFEELPVEGADNNPQLDRGQAATGVMWREHKGEIAVGRRPDEPEEPAISRTVYSDLGMLGGMGLDPKNSEVHATEIHYDRPLLEGERIEFELFHNTKAQTAAPMLGRLAYCLDGDKVGLCWVAAEGALKRFELSDDNRADDPAGEQLAPANLEDNAWNRLALRIEAGHVVLSSGDQDVYRRPLAKNESTLFGFFADPSAPETRIRNVVLKGDWPSELPKDLWELDE